MHLQGRITTRPMGSLYAFSIIGGMPLRESLIPMATLFLEYTELLSENNVDEIIGLKKAIDMLIGWFRDPRFEYMYSDIITPSVTIMAIGNGGRINRYMPWVRKVTGYPRHRDV